MKSQFQNIIFAVLNVVRGDRSKQAFYRTHNNLPCLSSAFLVTPDMLLNTVFYCAVVWVVQQMAFPTHNQKQSGKHSNVSIKSAGSKAKTFNQRPVWAKNLIDTDCQQKTAEFSGDVELNGCLDQLKELILKLVNPLIQGYRDSYVYKLKPDYE